MSVNKLDRDRYHAHVYGDEANNPKRPRKFLQDGMFFDGAGVAIGPSGSAKVEPTPVSEPIEVVEQKEPDGRTAELVKMSYPALKKVADKIHEASGEPLPAGGAGAKARLVKYIADNTE